MIAGGLMLLDAAAHGLAGWPGMRAELAKTNAGPELVEAVKVGWLFGSVALLAFGLVLLHLFRRRLQGEPAPTAPALVIGALVAGFGAWAFAESGLEPFYFVFMVPGALAVFAALGPSRA
jgi:hypothetical protein